MTLFTHSISGALLRPVRDNSVSSRKKRISASWVLNVWQIVFWSVIDTSLWTCCRLLRETTAQHHEFTTRFLLRWAKRFASWKRLWIAPSQWEQFHMCQSSFQWPFHELLNLLWQTHLAMSSGHINFLLPRTQKENLRISGSTEPSTLYPHSIRTPERFQEWRIRKKKQIKKELNH